jgi:hypothetical protein
MGSFAAYRGCLVRSFALLIIHPNSSTIFKGGSSFWSNILGGSQILVLFLSLRGVKIFPRNFANFPRVLPVLIFSLGRLGGGRHNLAYPVSNTVAFFTHYVVYDSPMSI